MPTALRPGERGPSERIDFGLWFQQQTISSTDFGDGTAMPAGNLKAIVYNRVGAKQAELKVLDCLKIPGESVYLPISDSEEAWAVIRSMQVGSNDHVGPRTSWTSFLHRPQSASPDTLWMIFNLHHLGGFWSSHPWPHRLNRVPRFVGLQ